MKTFEILIKPISGFGTQMKGDTLFGHICWQAVYHKELFGKSISDLLADYTTNPFLVISSAFIRLSNGYALKRPDMPLDMLFELEGKGRAEIIERRKELKAKRWMLIKDSIKSLKSDDLYINDNELFNKVSEASDIIIQRRLSKVVIKSVITDYTQPHNTINRLTGTTGEGQFAPYAVDQKVFIRDIDVVLFAGVRSDISIDSVITALKQIGATGFGKDASTGLGRFDVNNYKEIDLRSLGSFEPNACYTLAPCVPEKGGFSKIFFTPFVRFGRHGDVLAKSAKPFKNPVIMADEGAVFVVNNSSIFNKPYIGTAVTGISRVEPNAVGQGYGLYIPVRVEG